MEEHKCKERTSSGFMKWNTWTVVTNIMQTAVLLKREDAKIVKVGSRNLYENFKILVHI